MCDEIQLRFRSLSDDPKPEIYVGMFCLRSQMKLKKSRVGRLTQREYRARM